MLLSQVAVFERSHNGGPNVDLFRELVNWSGML